METPLVTFQWTDYTVVHAWLEELGQRVLSTYLARRRRQRRLGEHLPTRRAPELLRVPLGLQKYLGLHLGWGLDGLEKILAAAALSCDVVELTAAVMVRMEESAAAVRVSEQIRSASPNHNQIQ